MSLSAHWSNAWVTSVVGQPEWHTSLICAWPYSEIAICEAQWLIVLLLTVVLLACEFSFLVPSLRKEINSLLLKTYVTLPRHFDDSLYMHEKTYCSVALHYQAGRSELTTEKIAHISCWLWLKYGKCCKTLWATLVANPNVRLVHETK
jgi:hypothetical protein